MKLFFPDSLDDARSQYARSAPYATGRPRRSQQEKCSAESFSLHRRHDIQFVPHVGLGYFGNQDYDAQNPSSVPLDEARYRDGRARAESAALDFEIQLDRLTLIELDDQFTRTAIREEFAL